MSDNYKSEITNRQITRPWFLTVLLIIVTLFSIFKFFTFFQVLLNNKLLHTLNLTVPPLYLGLENLLWGVGGIFLAWSIWSKKSWTPKLGTILSLCYAAYYWVDRIWIAQPNALSGRWPIKLTFTILGLVSVLGALQSPASQRYYQKNPVKIT